MTKKKATPPPEPITPALDLTGELTIRTAAERRVALLSALRSADALDVGLSGVTELDTAGLQLLILVQREARHLGKTVRFRAPSAAVAGFLDVLHLTATLEEVNR
jgi:anti-sigma B factor antagonist